MAGSHSPSVSSDRGEDNSQKGMKRSYVACQRCHSHKVKCSGETPCRNCRQSRKPTDCVYPIRDRKIAIAESYLKNLEDENRSLKRKRSQESLHQQLPLPELSPNGSESVASLLPSTSVSYGNQNQGTQTFISDEASIQPMFLGEASSETFGNRLHQFIKQTNVHPPPRPYVYYKNQKLLRISSTDCQLPNKNYARLLVRSVLRFVGGDHHLLLRKSFLERLDETYRLETLDDPVWLCRLFTVFALGELYSARITNIKKGPGVPGTGFFVRAMGLFQDMHEETTVAYIETLLLLSFYLVALNRRNTAFTYAGLAVRLSMTLGLHRKIPEDSGLTAPEREHRVRVWWTCYALDRIYTSKVGLPISLRDEDIDVQLPSMDGLSPSEAEDFYPPELMIAQVKLARITGNVMSDLYRIPQPGRANTFVQSVQRILTSLRSWHETLPVVLRLDFSAMPIYPSRSVASLHLHFGNAVILTTRPILFHLFRSRFDQSSKTSSTGPLSPMTAALAEACIQAARTSNSILAQLWVDGCLAPFGFFDALSVFASTMILMMSATLKADNENNENNDTDAVETAWTLLRSMRDAGNLPASGYYDQLVELKTDLDGLRQRTTQENIAKVASSDSSSGLQMLLAASGSMTERASLQTTEAIADNSFSQDGMAFGVGDSVGAVLDDPFLQDFLQQPYGAWSTEQFDPATGVPMGQFQFDWQDANLW